ncbi:DUF6299 family protein [Streptantibioticus ferralitis]|uniref:DUF6299 family protein n=1 Tax=Streptantibioticus ferralitis TaxID=236510 RepID=A0ABT5Z944_9ACTN|nr:DUF6299 family protein [Streptantibioticus ferralitis]MDF2260351.1 DUF6299 family protein [Streptantibioticus ferralitis]
MRILPALSLAAAVAMVAAVGSVSAQADDGLPFNGVTVDQVGHLSRDGWVTLSGTYRCSPDGSADPVVIGASLAQGRRQYSIDSSPADCDGYPHRWQNASRPEGADIRPGGVHAQAILVRLSFTGLIPLPHLLAGGERDILLERNGR